jgi:hypothetical protein
MCVVVQQCSNASAVPWQAGVCCIALLSCGVYLYGVRSSYSRTLILYSTFISGESILASLSFKMLSISSAGVSGISPASHTKQQQK